MPARISRQIRFVASFLATLTIALTVAGPTAALAAPSGTGAAKPAPSSTTTTTKPAKTTTTTTTRPIPTLTTGQPDYSPGSVVDVHGTGFAASTTYAMPVKRPDGSIVVVDTNHVATPGWQSTTTDASGVLTYNYQLDGIFGSYEARAYPSGWAGDWSQAPIASVTFTDGPLPNSVTLRTWQTKSGGGWITGTLNANNSNYKEGETVPFQLDLSGVPTSGNPYTFAVCRDAINGSRRGYTVLMPFNTSRAATPGGTITSTSGNFSGVNVTINSATETNGQGGCNAGQLETKLSVSVSGAASAYVLWGGRLASPADPGVGFGNGASSYPGGSLAMTLENSTKSSGINPSGIIQLATITVTKVVDSGSATPDQWCFTISPNPYGTGSPTLCPASGTNSVQFLGLSSGTFTVTESTLANYAFASGTGTNCTFSGSTATATVTAGTPAVNASCTFHNSFVPPSGTLLVKKHVVNNSGGTKAASDFTLHVKNQGTGVDVAGSPAAGSESGTQYSLLAGTYVVSENSPPTGYTQTSITGDCNSSGVVTVTSSGLATCTITNTDVPAKLTVTKVVVNNNGGTKQVSDFPLFVGTTSVTSGVQNTFSAGTYTVSETNQAGYTGTITGDCAANGSITLAVGDVKSCTITNDDQAASLTVIKHVINNNGGSKAAGDFTITVGGGHVAPNATFAGAENPGTTVSLDAGSYTVDEGAHDGYTKSLSADCSGTIANGDSKTCTITNDDQTASVTLTKSVQSNHGGNAGPNDFGLTIGGTNVASGQTLAVNANTPVALNEAGLTGYSFVSLTGDPGCPTALGGTVTLHEGQSISCTIVNADKQSTLTVVKDVQNTHGGTAQPNDFKLTVNGGSVQSGVATNVLSNTALAINETQLSGYTFVKITGDPRCPAALGGSITLNEGENVTCTITNADQAASLTVIKHVINNNGGTKAAADFSLTVTGGHVAPNATFPGAENPGTTVSLDAGSYSVDEGTHDGYTKSLSAGCSGTIANGQSKTCTITNDDQAASLTVIKHVVNDNGGTKAAADFSLTVTGGHVAPNATFPGAENPGTTVSLDAGSYSVDEGAHDNYAKSLSADCSGTIANGQSKTCTITNDDLKADLTIAKSTSTPVVNPGDPISYTIVVGNNGPGTAVNVTVSDPLPAATGVSWSISPAVPGCTITTSGSPPKQTLSCTFASLAQTTPPSATAPITIKLVSNTTRQSCGTLSNIASAQADNNAKVTSGDPTTILLNCQPALSVTKVGCPATTVVPGGLLTYTINYSNTGTATATSAMLVDTLPPGTEVANAGGGTVNGQPGSQTVTWNLGDLTPNATGSRTLVVLVDAMSGTLTNSVTLSASNVPPEKSSTNTATTQVSNAGANTHGTAYGLDADVLILPVLHEVARVDSVAPGTPPAQSAEVLSVGVLGVAQVDAVRDTTRSAVTNESVSTSTSEVVGLNLLGGAITADVVKGVSQSVAGPFAATSNSAGSTFANLKINGNSITNVVPGQSITVKNPLIPTQNLASVVLQEETKSATSTNGKFTATHSINMLHVTLLKPLIVGLLTLPKGAEIIVAHANTDATYPSGLACGTSPSTVSGNAFSAYANGTFLGNTLVNAQTGDASITPFGGSDSDGAATVTLPGFVTAGAVTNSSTGSLTPNPNATSNSRVAGANVLGGIVTADVLDVTSTSNANGTTASTNFNTTFTNVQVHIPGVAQAIVLATVAPNTTFRIPVNGGILILVLNEQIRGGNGTKDTEGDINAVHAILLNNSNLITAEVIVAHAHSDAHKT